MGGPAARLKQVAASDGFPAYRQGGLARLKSSRPAALAVAEIGTGATPLPIL